MSSAADLRPLPCRAAVHCLERARRLGPVDRPAGGPAGPRDCAGPGAESARLHLGAPCRPAPAQYEVEIPGQGAARRSTPSSTATGTCRPRRCRSATTPGACARPRRATGRPRAPSRSPPRSTVFEVPDNATLRARILRQGRVRVRCRTSFDAVLDLERRPRRPTLEAYSSRLSNEVKPQITALPHAVRRPLAAGRSPRR